MMKTVFPLFAAALFVASMPAGAQDASEVPDAVLLALADDDAMEWEAAEDALDDGQWQDAAERFGALADRDVQGDAARFWQAYAQFRGHSYDAAQASLKRLEDEHPESRWREDARELRAEIRAALQGPVAVEADPEFKLFALRSLMSSDPDGAVAMLTEILDADAPAQEKQRALFMISQAPSDASWSLLAGAARGERGPELQRSAIRILGATGEDQGLALLQDIYASIDDRKLKGAILESFAAAGDADRLVNVARTETFKPARLHAIQMLGVAGAPERVRELIEGADDPDVIRAGMRALGIAGDVDGLAAVATTTTEPVAFEAAVHGLGMAGGRRAEWALVQIYRNRPEADARRTVLHALVMQDHAEAIVGLLRQETDPELRRMGARLLSNMDSPAAREYLRELAGGSSG